MKLRELLENISVFAEKVAKRFPGVIGDIYGYASVIASTVGKGGVIESCIIDNCKLIARSQTVHLAPIAYSVEKDGVVKNCLVQGTIAYGSVIYGLLNLFCPATPYIKPFVYNNKGVVTNCISLAEYKQYYSLDGSGSGYKMVFSEQERNQNSLLNSSVWNYTWSKNQFVQEVYSNTYCAGATPTLLNSNDRTTQVNNLVKNISLLNENCKKGYLSTYSNPEWYINAYYNEIETTKINKVKILYIKILNLVYCGVCPLLFKKMLNRIDVDEAMREE